MAVTTHEIAKRPGSTRVAHSLLGLDEDVLVLRVGPGILKTIFLVNANSDPKTYIKFWDKGTTVTPTSDPPDWQIPLINGSIGDVRHYEFDPAIGVFSSGLQISLSKDPGLTHGAPAVSTVNVFVVYDES